MGRTDDERLTPIPLPMLPPEQEDYLIHAYRGEQLVILSRACIEACGEERAARILSRAAREAGGRMGGRLREEEDGVEDLISLRSILAHCIEPYQNASELSKSAKAIEVEVSECPFSGSPPHVCGQIENYFDGLVRSFDRGFSFSYSKKMPEGSPKCCWCLKADSSGGASPAVAIDPFKRLAMRYAEGEMDEKEYRARLSVLKELHSPH